MKWIGKKKNYLMRLVVTYLEVENDGPYEAKCELRITVDDILGSYVDELDFLVTKKVQCHLDILQHVKTHSTSFPRLQDKDKRNDT